MGRDPQERLYEEARQREAEEARIWDESDRSLRQARKQLRRQWLEEEMADPDYLWRYPNRKH